jgi:SAM-dependent methyltransferase
MSGPLRRVARAVYRRVVPERIRLTRVWAERPSEALDRYLVSGYQDPHLNIQSILVRHRLTSMLFGNRYDELMAAELPFAIELNEILRSRAEELGVVVGSFLEPAKAARVMEVDQAVADRKDQFAKRWRNALAGATADRQRVLEFACGSANDYRALAEYGLARFIEYRGVDLNAANIANAKRRFPDVDFRLDSILDLPGSYGTFDLVIASDIFEHLSLKAMAHALQQAMRFGRRGVILSFFNMAEIPDHISHPKRSYYWNQLSRPRIEATLRAQYPVVEVIDVSRWLSGAYGYTHSYNPGAFSIFAREA